MEEPVGAQLRVLHKILSILRIAGQPESRVVEEVHQGVNERFEFLQSVGFLC